MSLFSDLFFGPEVPKPNSQGGNKSEPQKPENSFHNKSQIFKYDLKRELLTPAFSKKIGLRKFDGKFNKPATPKDIEEVLELIPDFGPITNATVQKIIGDLQKKINDMRVRLEPTEKIVTKQEQLRLLKEIFGL